MRTPLKGRSPIGSFKLYSKIVSSIFDLILACPILLPILLVSCIFIYQNAVSYLDEKAVKRLGSLAPSARNRLPFGTEHSARTQRYRSRFLGLDFTFTPNTICRTAKFYIARQRVILKADPKNIKAILACSKSLQLLVSVSGVVCFQPWLRYGNSNIRVFFLDKICTLIELTRPNSPITARANPSTMVGILS